MMTTDSEHTDSERTLVVWVAVLLMAASLMMVLWHLQPTSKKNSNTGSRFATVESIVDYGTYSIDKSSYRFTIDKVQINGKYYSSKPPLLPTYAAGFYWAFEKVTGKTFAKNESDTVEFCTFWTGWLSHLVTLLYFFAFCRRLFTRPIAILAALSSVCFSYLGAGFATTMNNHSAAAAFALAGFYHAYRARTEAEKPLRHYVFSGLFLGFLPGLDLPSSIISAAIGLYLLTHDYKRTLLAFLPAALPGIGTHLYLTHMATGSFLPVYLRRDLYKYAGSYWTRAGGIDALHEPKHIYAFHMLLGHHGLFSMTPLFFLSLIELVRNLRRKATYFREALVVTAIAVLWLTFYIFRSNNYGGWSVGVRWLVPLMPLLLLFFGIWVQRARLSAYKWALVAVFFAVGAYHTQDALSGPFQFSRWQNFIEGKPNRNRTTEIFDKDREQPPPRPRRAPKRR